MVLQEVIESLTDGEKALYEAQTASEYFRFLYYSIGFAPILQKLNSKELLSDSEWDYLIKRLFLVTVKAIDEEDSISIVDKVTYILNKIGTKVFRKESKMYKECIKMITFIDSITMEEEINEDLLTGLGIIEEYKSETDLDTLLTQHREASIFRDNQDAFFDSYKDAKVGYLSDQENAFMNSLKRAYIREKELVKKYKK